ncbi:MAG: glutathione S-transferase family protein [Sphingomonadaceae bacterium]
MKLYDMTLAPNPRRVRMFLAEKGLAVPTEQVDIQKGENLSPSYLAINPRGVVPTLVLDDGSILDESLAICRYFEGLHPEPNLFGRAPLEAARVESWQRRMEFEGMFNVAAVFRNTRPAYSNRGAPGAGAPTPQIPALAERGMVLARQWLDTLEKRLSQSEFVAGDRFTVADVTAIVSLDFARWVGLKAEGGWPTVAAWQARMRERPSYKA